MVFRFQRSAKASSPFPFISLCIFSLVVITSMAVAYLIIAYCTFGRGSFRCSAPMTGLGGLLFLLTIILLLLLPAFFSDLAWRLERWWKQSAQR